MKRSTFAVRGPARTAKPDRLGEFSSFKSRPTEAVMATPASIAGRVAAPAPARLPRKTRTDQAIRDAAQGQPCTIRLVGVCSGDPATSVWAHWPGLDGDRGMGIKALDICGAVACFACHDVIDGRRPAPAGMTRDAVSLAFFYGHMRSLVLLARNGTI